MTIPCTAKITQNLDKTTQKAKLHIKQSNLMIIEIIPIHMKLYRRSTWNIIYENAARKVPTAYHYIQPIHTLLLTSTHHHLTVILGILFCIRIISHVPEGRDMCNLPSSIDCNCFVCEEFRMFLTGEDGRENPLLPQLGLLTTLLGRALHTSSLDCFEKTSAVPTF